MKRDQLSYDEARELVEDCRAMMLGIMHDDEFTPFEALDEMADELSASLGLEPDYIDDLIAEHI